MPARKDSGVETPLSVNTLDLVRAYQTMALARRLDERMWRLARSGQGHFAVPCSGHEAIGVGYAMALRAGHDLVAPHYRDLSAMLVLGLTPRQVMLHYFARAADPCSGGRQPYAHWGSRELGIMSLQGPQPNHVTHGVGAAWGSRLLGVDSVTFIAFGDGGAQKGEVHEAMNFAAIHRLPCVFCIENNHITQSVPGHLESSVPDLVSRAAGYGMPGETVDGTDVVAVFEAAQRAVQRARRGLGPTLIEAHCFRFLPNTSNDDDTLYRSRQEVEEGQARDPLSLLRRHIPAEEAARLDQAAGEIADDAATWAQAQPLPAPETLRDHTYA